MTSIKVLRVIYDLQIGGVQRMLLLSLPILRDMGIESEICCLKEEGDMADSFRDKGFPVHCIPFSSRLDPIGLWKLNRLAKKRNIQVVQSHMYASNIAANYAFLFSRKIRVINNYHSQNPFYNRSQRRNARITRNVPSAYIAVSEAVKEPLLKNNLPENKIHIIHNGVECPDAAAPFPDRSPGEPLHIVWAGRFVKQKRTPMVAEIMAECLEQDLDVKITMVGDGPRFGEMKGIIRKMNLEGHIRLEGWQSDIRPCVRDADVYISTSRREGFPNTLLEVCAQGRGFIVSDIPPHHEVLGNSEAGYIVSDEVSGWVSKIEEISNNRAKIRQMGKEAFRIAQQFTVQNTCRKTGELYQRILKP